uniref:Uncharacterized protein n=1 Tax=Trichogramma kaykai TaxID=54128 RepID=A0ABD2WHH0_9HYME
MKVNWTTPPGNLPKLDTSSRVCEREEREGGGGGDGGGMRIARCMQSGEKCKFNNVHRSLRASSSNKNKRATSVKRFGLFRASMPPVRGKLAKKNNHSFQSPRNLLAVYMLVH